MTAAQSLTVPTLTGAPLGATLHRGGDRGFVVIGGATAVPHAYYAPLAAWLASTCGVDVLSFDYQGIGASSSSDLRRCPADYRSWAVDFGEAVAWAADRGPTVVVGHSFGGHAFGMTPVHARTRGLYTFATGAGWHGHMTAAESWRVRLLWNVVGPVLVAGYGYLPFTLLNMGEDLPRGVYADWKRWCRRAHYFFDDHDAEFTDEFARVRVPVVGVNSTDDAWAPPASARAFLQHYPTAELKTVTPADAGQRRIGHMRYVRPQCQTLWADLASFVDRQLAAPGRREPALAAAV
jgi:predicted alpha/beta hydrolase